MMLENVFNEMLDKYPYLKQMDFREHNIDFQKRISELLKIDNFVTKTLFGRSRWADNPRIKIISERFDNPQEALAIEYKFDFNTSTAILSIIPRLKEYSEYISIRENLIDILKNFKTKDFKIPDGDYSVLSKTYHFNNLDDYKLTDDLDFLIEIYLRLTGQFISSLERMNGNYSEYYKLVPNYNTDDLEEKHDILKPMEAKVFYELDYKIEENIYSSKKPSISIKNVKDISVKYPKENNYKNYLNNPKELFKDENIDKIMACEISSDEYKDILLDIKQNAQLRLIDTIKKYDLDINELTAKDKVLLFAKSFTKTTFKSVGKLLGSYSFGEIKIDDRLSSPLIITSIIHELSHFILEKILKEVLMKVLNTNDTPLISSYVKILLEDNDLNYLLDEFCAHTVEGRFALYGFQDYSSFKYKLDEISGLYQKEEIDYALIVANTFAYDIKEILEEFIDDDLREDIKDEFLNIQSQPNYEPLDLEIESKLDYYNFFESIALVLMTGIGESLTNPDKLRRYMAHFDEVM